MGARDKLIGAAGRALLRFTETKDAPTRRASGSNQYVFGGNPYTSTWDVERAVRDGMERVIWIARGIELNAQQVASWPVRAMQGDAPDWRQVEDPILPLFRSSRINPVDGSAYAFLVGLGMQFQLSKAGAFVEVIPNRAGGVAALYLLPPGQTKPIPDPDTFVSGFEVTHPGGEISRLKPYDPAKKSGVLWIKKRHPTNPYSSMTPLEAAGISIDLDFYARLYNRNFLLNDGRSGQLVAVKGGLSQEDAQELKARFSPGMGGAGRTTVIEADAITVQDTAMSPRDAQYAELRGITKEDLLLAVGIPESVFGNASGRTFDNADAEKEGWLDTTCKDLANWLGMGLDGLTAGGWDDDVHLWFDYSGEPVLQRTQRNRERDAADQVAAGLITVDEWRAVANLDAIGRPGSRVLWIPGGKAAVGDEEDEATAGELKPIGGGAPAPAAAGMTPQEMAATARGGAIAGAAQAQEVQESGALRESQNPRDDDTGDEAKALPFRPEHAALLTEEKRFNPKQPRYPRGHPKGGQWMSLGDTALWLAGKPLSGGYDSSGVVDPNAGTVYGGGDTGSSSAAGVLQYPKNYPYPRVVSAPPAKALSAPKPIQVQSIRKGDVINHNGKQYSVGTTKAGKNGGPYTLELVAADGSEDTIQVAPGGTLSAVARTPHPAQVAKVRAANANAVATPQPITSRQYQRAGTSAPASSAPAAPPANAAAIAAANSPAARRAAAGLSPSAAAPTVPAPAPAAAAAVTPTPTPAPPVTPAPSMSSAPGTPVLGMQLAPGDTVQLGNGHTGQVLSNNANGTVTVSYQTMNRTRRMVLQPSWQGTRLSQGATPTPPPAATPAPAVVPNTPPAPTTPAAAAPAAGGGMSLAQAQALVSPPANYPYPLVPGGAPPAKTLAAPKPLKVQSVRKGDVVNHNGQQYSVMSISGTGGTYKVGLVDANGGTVTLNQAANTNLDVVARTPLVAQVAAARRVIAGQPAAATPRTTISAAPTPAPAAAAAPTPSGGIPPTLNIDASNYKRIAPKSGLRPGGVYQAPDGQKYVIKTLDSETHVENEILTNQLYRAADVSAPTVGKATLGPNQIGNAKVGLASRMVGGYVENFGTKIKDPAWRDQLAEDFAVHAWVGNWDVPGGNLDNIGTGPDGKPMVIDAGAGPLFRAQGAAKGDAFGDEVAELKTMRDPSTNPEAARAFGGVTPDDSDPRFVAGVKKVLAVSPAQIDQMVDQTMSTLPQAERDALKEKLKKRREHLAREAKLPLPENVNNAQAPAAAPTNPDDVVDGGTFPGTVTRGSKFPGTVQGTETPTKRADVVRGMTVRENGVDWVVTDNVQGKLYGYRPGIDDPATMTKDGRFWRQGSAISAGPEQSKVTIIEPDSAPNPLIPAVVAQRKVDPKLGAVTTTDNVGAGIGSVQAQTVKTSSLKAGDGILINGHESKGLFVVTRIAPAPATHGYPGNPMVHGHWADDPTKTESGLFLAQSPNTNVDREVRVAVVGSQPVPDVPRVKAPPTANATGSPIRREDISDPTTQATIASLYKGPPPRLTAHPNTTHAGDIRLGHLYEVRGYNELPDVVSEDDLDAYVAGGEIELWRGVQASALTADLTEEFRSGKHFTGNGIYGNGTYTAYGKKRSSNAIDFTRGYAGAGTSGGALMRMTLKSDARVVDFDVANRQMRLEAKTNPAVAEMAKMYDSGVGHYAVYKGYDAIRKTNPYGSSDAEATAKDKWDYGFLVVLNRSAVRVSDKNRVPKRDLATAPAGANPPPLTMESADFAKGPKKTNHAASVDYKVNGLP